MRTVCVKSIGGFTSEGQAQKVDVGRMPLAEQKRDPFRNDLVDPDDEHPMAFMYIHAKLSNE